MVQFDKKEKQLLLHLLKKERASIDTPDEDLRYDHDVKWLALEERYEIFIENLIKKINS